MEIKNFFAQDTAGNIIASPTVYVYQPGTTTLATGLKDKNGASLSNPFTGATTGLVQFAANAGEYDVLLSSGIRQVTIRVRFNDTDMRADLTSTASGKGAALVAYKSVGTGAVQRTTEDEFNDLHVSVKRFGAAGDGVTNDTAAVLAGVAHLKSLGGGTLFFPRGTYKVTDEILIDSPGINLRGSGRRKVYPGVFSPSSSAPSTILPVHSKTAAVRFFNATLNTASSFSARDINIATVESGLMPVCAFGFDGSGQFHRDYTFDRVGIHGFTSAFDTYNTGGDTAFGVIKVNDCAINRNSNIARNLTGQWNGFAFERCEAGQNLVSGIDVKAQSARIVGNMLEGQPNAVRVSGNYRACVVESNYFESVSGSYVISLNQTLDAVVRGNFYQTITATETVKLTNDVGTTVDDRVIPSTYGSIGLVSKYGAIDPYPLGSASCLVPADLSVVANMATLMTEVGGYQVTPSAPHYALPDSAGTAYTTSGTGLSSATKTGLSIASGNYVMVAVAVSYLDAPALAPRMELRVNSGTTDGYLNTVFYNWDKLAKGYKGNTFIYFGVVKATASLTSMQVFLYPFGLSPAAGLQATLGAIAIYDMGATLDSVSGVGHRANVVIPHTHVQRVAAAPVAGTWPVGYKLAARAPAAAGYEGWICTAAGTPGTWKGYGTLQA